MVLVEGEFFISYVVVEPEVESFENETLLVFLLEEEAFLELVFFDDADDDSLLLPETETELLSTLDELLCCDRLVLASQIPTITMTTTTTAITIGTCRLTLATRSSSCR